jgi:hypothetical protein
MSNIFGETNSPKFSQIILKMTFPNPFGTFSLLSLPIGRQANRPF